MYFYAIYFISYIILIVLLVELFYLYLFLTLWGVDMVSSLQQRNPRTSVTGTYS